MVFIFLMLLRQPRPTLTDTLLPYTTLFRANIADQLALLDRPARQVRGRRFREHELPRRPGMQPQLALPLALDRQPVVGFVDFQLADAALDHVAAQFRIRRGLKLAPRSEEHTYELQSLMRISYAVFCLKQTQSVTRRPVAH